jgi:HPt (histidine-containing phosphotransfer) domain-containing protein
MDPNLLSSNAEFIFNVDDNCAALKINRAIYLRILGKAVEQTQKDLIEIDSALAQGKFDIVQALAHRFKGDYGNMRIASLSSIARELNELAKTTQDPAQAAMLLQTFKAHFQQLQDGLQRALGSV